MAWKPKAKLFLDPEKLIKAFQEMRMIPLPFIIHRIRLRHTEFKPEERWKSHYVYILEFGDGTYWLFTDATNYSGTGGSYFRKMEAFIDGLRATAVKHRLREDITFVQLHEYEMPYKLYWALYNAISGVYREKRAEEILEG